MLPQDLAKTVEVTFKEKKPDSNNSDEVNWHNVLSMTFLFVMPKGIQVENSSGTGGTAQPHTQMHPVLVSANGCLGGGQSLATPLNLALIKPFDTITFKWRGAMLMWIATSKAWEMAKRLQNSK